MRIAGQQTCAVLHGCGVYDDVGGHKFARAAEFGCAQGEDRVQRHHHAHAREGEDFIGLLLLCFARQQF